MRSRSSVFMDLLESFFSCYLPDAVGASDNTVKSYKYAFRLLMEYLNTETSISIDSITFDVLDYDVLSGFLEWIEKDRGCCPATKNQRLSALLSFSEYAQKRNLEAATVFRSSLIKIPQKKAMHKARTIFTADEVSKLLAIPDEKTATGLRDKVLLSFMYASGTRSQEVCDLTVRDISFSNERASIVVHGKGGKARRIGIPAECSRMLKDYLKYRRILREPNRHVFSSQTHEHMTVSCIEAIYKKYVKTAKSIYPENFNADSYPPHSMRHTTASHMLEAGVPLVVIKNFLGHASLQSTQIYAELSQETVDRHLKEWNEKWFSPQGEQAQHQQDMIPDFLRLK